MEQGSWICCEKLAVLHGGFLLAKKQSQHNMLLEMKKSDWTTLGKPIVCAVHEICDGRTDLAEDPTETKHWQRKVLAFVWAKLLNSNVTGSNVKEELDSDAERDRRWKEDLFFSAESMIPEINHTVLFEIVKSLGASDVFVELLSELPAEASCLEMTHFVDHVLDGTCDDDVAMFLDVWWELMKQHDGQRDGIVQTFGEEAKKYLARAADEFSHSSKRLKLDPDVSSLFPSVSMPVTSSDLPIPSLLLDGLKRLKSLINPYIYKCSALAKLSDMIRNSVLSENIVEVSTKVYLEKFARLITLGNSEVQTFPVPKIFIRNVKETERELRATSQKSSFQLPEGALTVGIELLADLLHSWVNELQSEPEDDTEIQKRHLAIYRTAESLKRFREICPLLQKSKMVSEDAKKNLSDLLLNSATFVQQIGTLVPLDDAAATDKVKFSIVLTIIDRRMERYAEICEIFASSPDWALSADGWLDCLERNQDIFQDTDIVLRLAGTLKEVSSSGISEVSKLKRLMNIILDCLTALSVADKNKALLGILSTYDSKGLCRDEGAFKDWFEEEVNMVFNCITHSEAAKNFDKAVNAIARVAFLNPEATLQKACHLAAVNLGAHKLLGQILKNLPALTFKDKLSSDGLNIFAKCLLEAAWDSFATTKGENQFLEFLTSLMEPGEGINEESPSPLLQPADATKIFVLPYLMESNSSIGFPLKVLNSALKTPLTDDGTKEHWLLACCPFPLIFALSQLLDRCILCWEEDSNKTSNHISIETKGLLIETLNIVCDVVGQIISRNPDMWSTSVCWLYRKTEQLDWTMRLWLKSIFGDHFKYEVPATLFEVCDLSDDGWSPLNLPQYGPGTGLLAWVECCCISTNMMECMLSHLTIDAKNVEEINMFSKGFLIALIQVLPWCSCSEWKRLNHVVNSLLQRELLHVPYTLEYVHYMPLLNLRPFAHHLQFSQLLLRAFQLICSCSCSDWLPAAGWKYVARQCAGSMSDILESLRCRLKEHGAQNPDGSQEATFVVMQLFCHVIHIMVMMPSGTSEPLYYVALELLSQYEILTTANSTTSGLLSKVDEKHFLYSIAENLSSEEQRSVLLQKISKIC
ncbi:gem-associated protein 4 [Chiloscyllium plagiosum]|uniref:gem-associated protein 4 n=1 Tax=Chiloscyllium plagiosum TaxID=36176 RepID=UPI001CB7CE0C|nr:gem-associated protein 4 [Chiloscyllium plagiosum]XP_043574281.1 gem-associated protein 4 [Chiloscyllium plagiosum]XP_043574282.1 gem-associated protein 4 [Chiloscyllium plagiosum]XP_043574283.1 gem-associated protein 4 [Chiloscyllium plagiosum]XP_043574284.1 gem-associated protein 4 [Chiloscyllium plagiosum]XP_043574285.1 gem-associated protein 4 [Chiloscyllium plagiosum]